MAASTPIRVYDRELNATEKKLAAYCCTIAVEHPKCNNPINVTSIYIPINTTEICLDTLNVDIQGVHLLCGDFNAHNPA